MRQLTRPAWKSCWCLETPAGDGVVLRSETCVRFLVGRGVRLLANLLNGQRTVEDLIAELASEVPEERSGLNWRDWTRPDTCETGFRNPRPPMPGGNSPGWTPAASRQARAEAAIDVVALGQSTAQTARQTLSGLNVRVDATARFRLVIASPTYHPRYRQSTGKPSGKDRPGSWLVLSAERPLDRPSVRSGPDSLLGLPGTLGSG